jgi:hypothetical protein
VRRRSAALVVFVVLLAGCGNSSRESAGTVPASTARTTTAMTTSVATTTSATVTFTTPSSSSKAAYERAMQSRLALFTPQCYAFDPAAAQRERIARFERAVSELEVIRPPDDVARAHALLLAATRGQAALARKLLPRYEHLSKRIREAHADGEVDGKEQSTIQVENQKLFTASLDRRLYDQESSAFQEFRRQGYDVMQKGPAKAEYQARIQAVVDQAGKPSLSFHDTSNAAELRSQLAKQRGVAYDAARALGQITPRPNTLNAQNKLLSSLCSRAQRYEGLAETLKTRNDAQTVRLILGDARGIDRIVGLYPIAFSEYRSAGYEIHPATRPG